MGDQNKTVRFFRALGGAGGTKFPLGVAVQSKDGWRFIPNVFGRRSSRKFHPSMEKCVPRWVGWPDKCTSEAF